MKKTIFLLIALFVTFNVIGQRLINKKNTQEVNYSESTPIKVVYKDSVINVHNKNRRAAVFVNGNFIGSENVLQVINSDKIESIAVEKGYFEKNQKRYYGKLLVKMKPKYTPNFITLNQLFKKHLDLDEKPIVILINDEIMSEDYKEFLVDENFILKIIVNNLTTSQKNAEVNLIKIITKTSENIQKANEMRIK